MELVTLDRVKLLGGHKASKGAAGSSGQDDLYKALITSVSTIVEQKLDRHVERKQRTEYLSVPFGTKRAFLDGYPITNIQRVWNDTGREFGIDDDTVSTTVNAQSLTGQKVLNVAATTDFAVDDVIAIDQGGDKDEEGVIASIQAGTSLTLDENLTYTHEAADEAAVIVSPTSEAINSDYYTYEQTQRKCRGIVWFTYAINEAFGSLKVTYTGGMAASEASTDATGTSFQSAYPDLAMEVAKQVLFESAHKSFIGMMSRSGRSGSRNLQVTVLTWMQQHGNLLPDLINAIKNYKRKAP